MSQCRGQIFCDEHGRVEFVSGVTFDITAQKKIEEELSRQNEKYRFLAEEYPIGIAVIDRDGHLTYINRKFEEIFGYSLEDIPTKRKWLLRAYPDKELRKRATYLEYQSLNDSLGEDAGPIKSNITCKDGSIRTIELKPFQLASGDLYVIYEDVTDREQFQAALKQSDVKYRTLVEQIPAVTYITSLDGAQHHVVCLPTDRSHTWFLAGRL